MTIVTCFKPLSFEVVSYAAIDTKEILFNFYNNPIKINMNLYFTDEKMRSERLSNLSNVTQLLCRRVG